ncbi:preprotein translocase YidC [Micromonospora sp. NPDC051296]|uniref:preprotein translocase YidC n=1 Tax=Micromonospora sp. NPDC051296 TaxID=3155046 RepID=UPI003434BBF3
MGFRTRQGEQPIDPEHAEDDAGQARLVQVEADTDVPTDAGARPDLVTEDDGSGVAGGASGSSGGGSSMPGHPDAPR